MYRLILLFILSFLSQGFVSNSKYNLQSQNNLVATVYGSQTLLYNHVDRQNNIRVITDHDRRPLEFYSYTPYGERTIHTRWFGQNRTTSHYDNSFAFTGRYHDKETGLYYFRARYYDSEQGRFISRDPAGYIDGMGLYNGYFASHFGLDPSGQWWFNPKNCDSAFEAWKNATDQCEKMRLLAIYQSCLQERSRDLRTLTGVIGIIKNINDIVRNGAEIIDTISDIVIPAKGLAKQIAKQGIKKTFKKLTKSSINDVVGVASKKKGKVSTPSNDPDVFKPIGKGKNKAFENKETGEVFKKNSQSHGGENYNKWKNKKRYKKNPNDRDDSVWSNSGDSRKR